MPCFVAISVRIPVPGHWAVSSHWCAVEFESVEAAQRAFARMNGVPLPSTGLLRLSFWWVLFGSFFFGSFVFGSFFWSFFLSFFCVCVCDCLALPFWGFFFWVLFLFFWFFCVPSFCLFFCVCVCVIALPGLALLVVDYNCVFFLVFCVCVIALPCLVGCLLQLFFVVVFVVCRGQKTQTPWAWPGNVSFASTRVGKGGMTMSRTCVAITDTTKA
jgi:hypothetical protein